MLDSGHVTDDEGRIFNVHLRTTETRNVSSDVTQVPRPVSVVRVTKISVATIYTIIIQSTALTPWTSLTSLTLTTTMHGIMSLEIALRALYNV